MMTSETRGERIVRLRKRNGLTQEKLAELVGVSRSTLTDWSIDKFKPSTTHLTSLASALHVSEAYIEYGSTDPLVKAITDAIVSRELTTGQLTEIITCAHDKLEGPSDEMEVLSQALPMGIALFDRELRYVRINDRLAAMNGSTPAEIVGCTVREIVPDLADNLEPVLRGVLDTGEPVLHGEVSGATDAASHERTFCHIFHAVRGAGGIEGVLVLVTEVDQG